MSIVLDASAVLCFLQAEPGFDKVDTIILHDEPLISSVNWAEVIQKSLVREIDTKELAAGLVALGLQIISFDAEQSEIAGQLWLQTKQFGLSLGDRACLSLALTLNVPVLTADRAWHGLDLPIEIQLLR